MATVLDPNDEQQKQNQGEQVVNSNTSGSVGSQSAPSSGSSPGQPGGGGFTNLQQYVTANQGNDAQMGQQLQGKVASDAQSADQANQTYQSGAQSQIQSQTVNQDPNIIGQIQNNAQSVNKDIFNKQYNATSAFTAPTTADQYQGYGDAQAASQKVQSEGQNAAGDNEGRRNLLSTVYARPDYSGGQQNLDSFLLGAGQDGQAALKNINQQYGNYGQNFDAAKTSIQGAIGQALQTNKATEDATRQAAANAQKAYTGQFQNLLTTVQGQAGSMTKQYQGAVSGMASKDAATRAAAFKAAGIDPTVGEYLRGEGYDPAQIVSAGKAQSLGDVASGNDVSNYNALQGLLGANSAFDFSKAGGGTQAINTDQGRLTKAQQAQQMLAQAQSQMAAQNAQRTADFNNTKASLSRNVYSPVDSTFGISPADYAYASAHGINPADFITQGRALQLGDVMDTGKYSGILGALGITPKENFSTPGAAGQSYNYNLSGFNQKVSDARAAEAAANAAKPPTPAQQAAQQASQAGSPINWGTQPAQAVAKAADQGGSALDKATGGNVAAARKRYGI